VAHFDSISVEMTITLFMILACTNFTLLYYVILLQPGKLIGDNEGRAVSSRHVRWRSGVDAALFL
jgi:Trk-type K+ transport system membrane component